MIFCTLFNSGYLDKGLAMYDSLSKVGGDFKLYIFCFDEKCFSILNELSLKHAVLVKLCDFETKELLEVKKVRSVAEYCWTCTPFVIKHVFSCFMEKNCTYIDADLLFFTSPKVLFDEMPEDKSVLIVSHFFSRTMKDRILEKLYGKYCVQFNYFRNNESGNEVLSWWSAKCLEWCFAKIEKDRMGDQKYLNFFIEKFPQVHSLRNRGGGIAPWNIKQYRLINNKLYFEGETFDIIFYHFQNLRYINETTVNINVGRADKALKNFLYCTYLDRIIKTRKLLYTEFNYKLGLKKNYSENVVTKFIRRNVMQYIIRVKSDVITNGMVEEYMKSNECFETDKLFDKKIK